MPGRLRSSFRQGNLAEDLGLFLLKGVSAVAEVARPEDVGLDAIATLLRRDTDGNCYAEDTFVVQLKSASESSIIYDGHALEWLVGQTQPIFIGTVSLRDSSISLYPTLFVNQAVLSLHAKKVTVRFGESGIAPAFVGQKFLAWRSEGNDAAAVWLGNPLLTWSASDLSDSKWATRTYTLLKAFIAVAQRELALLSFGQISIITWSTNDNTSIKASFGLMKGSDEIESVADKCMPGLHALAHHAMSIRNDCGLSLLASLVEVAAVLRRLGIEIDKENIFAMFLHIVTLDRRRDEIQES